MRMAGQEVEGKADEGAEGQVSAVTLEEEDEAPTANAEETSSATARGGEIPTATAEDTSSPTDEGANNNLMGETAASGALG